MRGKGERQDRQNLSLINEDIAYLTCLGVIDLPRIMDGELSLAKRKYS
jgi:hypothetical protein